MDKSRYRYFEELFADIQLIWSNCKTYNVSGSDIYKLAENMERRSKKLIKDLRVQLKIEPSGLSGEAAEVEDEANVALLGKPKALDEEDEDFGFDPERYVPFKEKVELSTLITKATKDGLTQAVEYLIAN